MEEILELGQTYVRGGNYAEADLHFSRALEKEPANSEAWFWKGITSALRGRLPEADTYWHKSGYSIEETINHIAGLLGGLSWDIGNFLIDLCRSMDKWPQWKDIFLSVALRISPPQVARYYIEVADQAATQKHFNNAALLLERALQIDPAIQDLVIGAMIPRQAQGSGYMWLSFQLGAAGELDQAAEFLEKILWLDRGKKAPVIGSYLKGGFYENGKSKPTTGEGYGWLEFQARHQGDKSRARFYLNRREQLLVEMAQEYEKTLLYEPARQPEIAYRYLELATLASGVKRKLAKTYLQRSKKLGNKTEAKKRAKALGVRLSWF